MLLRSRSGDAAFMGRKALAMTILFLALAPAARMAWQAREMPHFGHLHDDSIYFVCAKSLAQGDGYRILSLPAEPFQTKYPPLWPLILACIWKIDPRFPENLKLATLLGWLMLPVLVFFAWRWFRAVGFGLAPRTAMCAILALSPWVVFLSTTIMSELIFSILLLAAMLAIGRAQVSPSRAVVAGLVASAAYLVKTAALPLLLAGPLWLILRRKYRAAGVMLFSMLPAVVLWTSWARMRTSPARDVVSLYYTNYF